MADAQQKGFIYNFDVYGFHVLFNRAIKEAMGSQSSGVSGLITFDTTRVKQVLANMEVYRQYVVSQPQVDLPETFQTPFPLETDPTTEQIENDALWQFVNMLEIFRDEMKSCQSARLGSGLIKYDNDRVVGYLGRLNNFVTDFIGKTTPVDLPASSPSVGMGPKPSTGV